MDSCPGRGFGDSLGGILDCPYLPPSFPQALPLLNVNRGPRKQTCSLSRGHPGTPMSCRGRSTSQSPGAGAQGLGQGTASCLPGPGGGCLLETQPGGSFSSFGSSTFAPLAVAAQAARGSNRFLLEGSIMNPRRQGSAQGSRLWFRRCPCPSPSKPGFP